MFVGVVGLGLIGASLSKAVKLKTGYRVFGVDKDNDINIKAKVLKVIDDRLGYDNMGECKFLFLCMHPQNTISYIRDHSGMINADTVVIDCCGIKQGVCREAFEIAEKNGFTFIGGHPIVWSEKWGFDNSKPSLFDRASMVLTPPHNVSIQELDAAKNLLTKIGFSNIEICSPREHDRIIAYTSELLHIMSSAYIKSRTANEHYGFSDDNFGHFIKLAGTDKKLWSELFCENRAALLPELDALIANLVKYRTAIFDGNKTEIERLISEGKEKKEYMDGKAAVFWK